MTTLRRTRPRRSRYEAPAPRLQTSASPALAPSFAPRSIGQRERERPAVRQRESQSERDTERDTTESARAREMGACMKKKGQAFPPPPKKRRRARCLLQVSEIRPVKAISLRPPSSGWLFRKQSFHQNPPGESLCVRVCARVWGRGGGRMVAMTSVRKLVLAKSHGVKN